MKAVLVTGARGNVGAEVVRQLVQRGAPVRAAVSTARSGLLPDGVEAVEFDFRDPATYAPALSGIDRVFLMRPPQMSDVEAFRPFIEAMAEAGVERVVFLSVQGAGRNVFVPHHGIEVLLRKSGLSWTFLRPSFFMQNLTTTHLSDIRDRSEIFVPAGNGRTNFIDVADIGEAAAVCLIGPGHDRQAYELTGAEALTYEQVAAILSSACGRTITYPRPSSGRFKARMREYGHDEGFVGVMTSIYAVARFGMAAGTTDTFRTLVGRRPRTLAEWAEENAATWS